jgi:hypothetical protein
MRYTIYEDPRTHRFAFLQLPHRFVEGDKLPAVDTDRWFGSREEAVAALPELLDREEDQPVIPADEAAWIDDGQS